MKCKKCGHDKFNTFNDLGCEYSYCQKCGAAYDEDGYLLAEGPEPEPEEEVKNDEDKV